MTATKIYLKPQDVKYSLANTPQLTFEVTDACNLNCMYCGYGDMYDDHDRRENKKLSIKKAYRLLDYLNELWNSPMNVSHARNIYVSFYGGEPLLNMDFVRKVVDYLENLHCPARAFHFSMTTNAILLHRYMNYLAEHNFSMLISLDGDRENMGYRVDHQGRSVFDRVIQNVDLVREKHPEYFKNSVSFNAVLHNRNSVESIHRFFKERYGKMPNIAELNNTGIREDKIELFEKTYRNSVESLYQAEHYSEIMKEMALQIGSYKTVGMYLMQYSEFVYRDYNELLFGKHENPNQPPTGTCLPFSKKIYITVNGKLLPCERIGHQYALGNVTDEKVELDYKAIANKYNSYYAKMEKQCQGCFIKKSCIQCIYNLEDADCRPVCSGYMNKQEFERYQNAQIEFLSNNPKEYYRIMEDLTVV